MQTNEIRNCIVHYHRGADGTLTEAERIPTGGAGSGVFKPVSGQRERAESRSRARQRHPQPDKRFLFATNGGDNSVSSFSVGKERRAHAARRQADGQRRER